MADGADIRHEKEARFLFMLYGFDVTCISRDYLPPVYQLERQPLEHTED